MWISSLQLKNFRNFESESFAFSPSFNILIGKNAQGKTSVLEAFAFLSNGHSFRAHEWRDAILRGSSESVVQAKVLHELGSDDWRLQLNQEHKVRELNEKRTGHSSASKLVTILFAPEEIQLLRESPAARRRYLDEIIRRYDPLHWTTLRNFERVLKQRNALLHDEEKSWAQREALLSVFDEQHALLAARLVTKRHEWSERLNEGIGKAYQAMAPLSEARFVYQPWFGPWQNHTQSDLEGFVRAELLRRRPDELLRRSSLVGPHRDDVLAQLNGNLLARFGSQGEHRSFVLAVKMAELNLHQELTQSTPIFLLDDVASELDERRRELFFATLHEARGQVLVTATESELVLLPQHAQASHFSVQAGKAQKIT